MSDVDGIEVTAPDAGEFDLIEWIDGHHSYPEYTVRVHTDKNAVAIANRLLDDAAALEEELAGLESALKDAPKTTSLTETGPQVDEVNRKQRHLIELRRKRRAVLDKAKGSALDIVLRKPPQDDEGDDNVFERAVADLREQFPDMDLTDQKSVTQVIQANPAVARRQAAFLLHQMIASVTTASGAVLERGPRLPLETVAKLLNRLEASDMNRLNINMNMAMAGAQLREEQIDAGFPG